MQLHFAAIFTFLLASSSWGNEQNVPQCLIDASIDLADSLEIWQQLNLYNERALDPQPIESRWTQLNTKSPEVLEVLNNPVSKTIKHLISKYSIEGEGFLIGMNGGLVAATNKTTDYYQGDEEQFYDAIKLPHGKVWLMKNVIDDSASAMLLKIAVPVFTDSSHTKANGVLVIGLYEFVLELYSDCRNFEDDKTLPALSPAPLPELPAEKTSTPLKSH